jgi:hypothetical protein
LSNTLDTSPVDVTVETGVCTPKDIWDNKNKWFEDTKKSREEWEKLADENREAMINLVKNAIARMYDRVDEWVPESFEFESGNFVGCHFKILCTDIDKEIERAEAATSFQIAEASKETAIMASEFDDGEAAA